MSGGQAGALADVAAAARAGSCRRCSPTHEARLNALLTFGQGFNPCDVTGEIATNPALVGDLYDAFGATPGIDTVVYARKELTGDVGHARRGRTRRRPGRGPRARRGLRDRRRGRGATRREVYGDAGIPVFASAHELLAAMRLGRLAGWRPSGSAAASRDRATSPHRVLERLPPAWASTPPSRPWPTYGFDVTREELVQRPRCGCRRGRAPRLPGRPEGRPATASRTRPRRAASCWTCAAPRPRRHAYDDVMAAVCAHLGDVDIDGVLVSQQVPPGVEMIAGVTVDPDFGPLVLVGLGGIFTEVLRDVVAAARAGHGRARPLAMIRDAQAGGRSWRARAAARRPTSPRWRAP